MGRRDAGADPASHAHAGPDLHGGAHAGRHAVRGTAARGRRPGSDHGLPRSGGGASGCGGLAGARRRDERWRRARRARWWRRWRRHGTPHQGPGGQQEGGERQPAGAAVARSRFDRSVGDLEQGSIHRRSAQDHRRDAQGDRHGAAHQGGSGQGEDAPGISSSAYGSEEILLILLPMFGIAAYALLLPMTLVVLVVLVLVTLCYRQVVMLYTKAGGSYVVARENFGPIVAQVAAVALMVDYIVTVAVQSAAGTNAVTSAIPWLVPYNLEITVAVVLILFFGNLRGLRGAGRTFAFPTYFFAGSMTVVIIGGLVREVIGDLPHYNPLTAPGAFPMGHSTALLSFGAIYILLKSFANGGSSLTGLEAISNGVSTFKSPRGLNARKTLVVMSCILGFLVAGVSWLAHQTHAVAYDSGSPTVISQVAKAVLGTSMAGHIGFLLVQLATMLILYTGANTPFNGFPFLANFVAADGFLPRWLTKRGHRLAFSNGIVVLTVAAMALLLGTGAHVDKLVAFYAIGVFTGFTLAGFGMAKHFRTFKGPHWKANVALNNVVGAVSGLVVLIFAVTKFTEGAWLVVFIFPVMVIVLLRLHRAYNREAALLEAVPSAQPVVRAARSTVVVLVDSVDLAVIRAIRYAHTLRPSELHVVHFVIDSSHAADLRRAWDAQPGMDLSLELVDCPDRRLPRAALELTERLVAEGASTQVTMLLPRRSFGEN